MSRSGQGSQILPTKGDNDGEGGGGDFKLLFNFDETDQQRQGGGGKPADARKIALEAALAFYLN